MQSDDYDYSIKKGSDEFPKNEEMFVMNPLTRNSNRLLLFIVIIYLTLGGMLQANGGYLGLIISQYGLILIPSLIYIIIQGRSVKAVLKLNRVKSRDVVKLIPLSIFMYITIVFLQAIVTIILFSIFGEINAPSVPLPENMDDYIISLIVVGLTPGICEEVLFRGVLLDGYEQKGFKFSIIFTSILFGLMHFTIMNFIGPTLLGIVFALLTYKTGSIIPGMIGHMLNNTIAMTLSYIVSNLSVGEIESGEAGLGLSGLITMGVMAILSGIIAIKILKSIGRPISKVSKEVDEKIVKDTGYTWFSQYWPVIIFAIIYIIINLSVLIKIR